MEIDSPFAADCVGSTQPIVAALGERGDAVNDRVHKVRFDRLQPRF
jgi:hypothetical protein